MKTSWRRLLNSIAFKISVLIALVVATTMVAMAWLMLREERHVLELELQKKGKYLAEVISYQIVEPLLYEERYAMYSLLQSTISAENGIVIFAEVYGVDGEPIVKVYEGESPPPFMDRTVLSGLQSADIKDNTSLKIYDISLPIITKRIGSLGYLRLGITKKFLFETLTSVKRKLYLLSSIIILSGIMAGLLMARKIIKPITILNQGVKRIGSGELGAKVEIVGDGEIKELSIAFNEMSMELKESVDAMKTAQENLIRIEKLYALGEFSAGLAHEIKNPLTSIKMLMQSVKEKNYTLCATDIEIIEGEINRIDRIVKDFLAFARPAKTELINTDINELLKDVITLSKLKIEQSNINLIEELDYRIPKVMVYPDGIRQVILNIILNAIQAMKHGGTLKVISSTMNGVISACIHDTGHGIPEENRNRIFDPFFTTKEDGTGMGLAIAYRIVSEHGGNIEVNSKPGRGTMVSILLPIAR